MKPTKDEYNWARDKRKEPIKDQPMNWLTDMDVDFCDRHGTAFRMTEKCPKCHPPEPQGEKP